MVTISVDSSYTFAQDSQYFFHETNITFTCFSLAISIIFRLVAVGNEAGSTLRTPGRHCWVVAPSHYPFTAGRCPYTMRPPGIQGVGTSGTPETTIARINGKEDMRLHKRLGWGQFSRKYNCVK